MYLSIHLYNIFAGRKIMVMLFIVLFVKFGCYMQIYQLYKTETDKNAFIMNSVMRKKNLKKSDGLPLKQIH